MFKRAQGSSRLLKASVAASCSSATSTMAGPFNACISASVLIGGPVPDSSRQGRQRQRYGESGERLVAGCIPVKFLGCSQSAQTAQICMITTASGKGLVFPKGGWEDDESVESAAQRETVEEAGVRGVLEEPLLGVFCFSSGKHSQDATASAGSTPTGGRVGGVALSAATAVSVDGDARAAVAAAAAATGATATAAATIAACVAAPSASTNGVSCGSCVSSGPAGSGSGSGSADLGSARSGSAGSVSGSGSVVGCTGSGTGSGSGPGGGGSGGSGGSGGPGLCKAYIYVMHVAEELPTWPESKDRQRVWCSIAEACRRCKHQWMRDALAAWVRRKGWEEAVALEACAAPGGGSTGSGIGSGNGGAGQQPEPLQESLVPAAAALPL